MKINVWNTILQLSRERGVETSVIVNAIKESLQVASRKYFSHEEKIKIHFEPEKGELRIYAVKLIADKAQNLAAEITLSEAKKIDGSATVGDYIEIDLPSDTLGRISAQAAKQVIFQKVRSAEQEKIYATFAPRIGEIVTGVVRQVEPNNNIVIEINKAEILLPHREKMDSDDFRRGDRVKAVIIQVLREERPHQIIVSRTSPQFLIKLLELEIPEIADGTIEIKNICRQAAERAKVSVYSLNKDIDPIGACIGVKGNRILAISKELQGEKIDVIPWSNDTLEYAKSALSPARPESVTVISQRDKTLLATVPADQLSLAIGKKGLNVRLASRLVGWKIEIKKKE